MKFERVNLTKDVLIEIKKIDDLFYSEDVTTLDWYLERYTQKHIAYLIKDDDKIIGYIVSVPVKKALYNALINGVLVNDININPEMFVQKSRYNYIVSFVLLSSYRHKGIGTKLIKNIIKNVKRGYYCALAVSKEGNSLSRKFMKLKKKINDDISVYEIKL